MPPPTAARDIAITPISGSVVQARWRGPLHDGGLAVSHYLVRLSADGLPDEADLVVSDDSLTLRGLAEYHRYRLTVVAVNPDGASPAVTTPTFVPADPPPTVYAATYPISLTSSPRQRVRARLGDIEARLRVWWQASDQAWYGSLEQPPGTLITAGRRLAVNAGLADGRESRIGGNIVCRAVDDDHSQADPGLTAWTRGTHALFWEPA